MQVYPLEGEEEEEIEWNRLLVDTEGTRVLVIYKCLIWPVFDT